MAVGPLIAWAANAHEKDRLAGTTPAWVEVGSRDIDPKVAVTLKIIYGDSKSLLAPTAGTVTSIPAEASTAREGRSSASIDGHATAFYGGEVPFYRPLDSATRGSDVEALNDFLARLSLPHADGAEFTAQTGAGVRALQRRLGYEADGTFQPGYVYFLPNLPQKLIPRAELGDVLAQGAPVFDTMPEIIGVQLAAEDASHGIPPAFNAGRRLVLEVAGGELGLTSPQIPASSYAQLAAMTATATAASTTTGDRSEPAVLSGVLRLAAPERVATVPGTAIYTDAAGRSCVFQAAGANRSVAAARAVAIEAGHLLPSTEIGVAYVQGSLVGTAILVNAYGSQVEKRTCG